jgi:hypothetical protein
MDHPDALPVGSYALPNSLPVFCLYHRPYNGVWVDGNTGPLIHRDSADRASLNPSWQVNSQPYDPGLSVWTFDASLDCRILCLDSAAVSSKSIARLLINFRVVAPPDCL